MTSTGPRTLYFSMRRTVGNETDQRHERAKYHRASPANSRGAVPGPKAKAALTRQIAARPRSRGSPTADQNQDHPRNPADCELKS